MPETLPAIIPANGVDTYRMSTDAATICRNLVLATAMEIQGRKYVKAEGWQAIAVAHGCAASACDVQRVEGGFRATGQVRRMDTGAVIAEAEGFVGEDEATWFGGEVKTKWGNKMLPKRPDFAIRAMAQTRAISRACRSAFAHVVVQIDKNLGTTPAEEMQGVYDHNPTELGEGAAPTPTPAPGPKNSSANGRALAADEPHLIDHTRAKGTMPKKEEPLGRVEKAKRNAKDWVTDQVINFNESELSIATLRKIERDNGVKLDWLKTDVTDQHERFYIAFNNAWERALARGDREDDGEDYEEPVGGEPETNEEAA